LQVLIANMVVFFFLFANFYFFAYIWPTSEKPRFQYACGQPIIPRSKTNSENE
jgi:hypothetical protein